MSQPSSTTAQDHSHLPSTISPHSIVILDAGAQYSKVIDRRVRELACEAHIRPLNTPIEELQPYAAIIISGGPQSVYGADAPAYDPRLFSTELQKPILGICYGMQLMNAVCGGQIRKGGTREDGQFMIKLTKNEKGERASPLYRDLSDEIEVLLTHGDSVTELAPGFEVTATSPSGIVASIENPSRKFYGVQYHPEVDLTPQGNKIFENFLTHICHVPRNFTLQSRKQSAIQEIREIVGEKSKVLCLLSGGVDSSVCAALLKEAIGADRIIAIHIDNGFMRYEESARAVKALESIGLKIDLVDARERFYNGRTTINGVETQPLNTVTVPEHKRKIIGDTFIRVCEEELRKFGLNPEDVFLAQGTLRPDLIESASNMASVGGTADVIKTHHNDTALVRELRTRGRIIEPLKDLHKDEVRLLGLELGLPPHLIWRQPFPGPGLAVRIICALEPFVTGLESQILQQLKSYRTPEIAVSLLACRTVGVQGDSRSYSSLVGLSSTQAASPLSYSPDWSALFELAKTIPKTVHGVNRVVYVFGETLTQEHYTHITPTLLTPECIHQLQLADEIVNKILLKYDLVRSLSQVPVILFPIDFQQPESASNDPHQQTNNKGKRSICIRTFITNDFMTGVPALPTTESHHSLLIAPTSSTPSQSPTPQPSHLSVEDHTITTASPPDSPPHTPTVSIPTQAHPVPLSRVRAFPTMPLAALQEMVREILKEVPNVARVCFDLTSKPPATTEWE